MTVAYVSLTLTGGVRLVSQSKNLSKKEIELVETKSIQKINISDTMMKSILNGTSLPSETLLRANDLKINVKGKWIFNHKKWNTMSDYAKLHMFYEDLRVDLGATSHTIHFIA